jgi:hypothetical protein
MAPEGFFLVPDCEDERTIHGQSLDCPVNDEPAQLRWY